MNVVAAAVAAAIVAGTIATFAPRPADVVGVVAVAGLAALAVIVAHLTLALRDRDRRLDRIERRINEADEGVRRG
jgi:hypothetical protein